MSSTLFNTDICITCYYLRPKNKLQRGTSFGTHRSCREARRVIV